MKTISIVLPGYPAHAGGGYKVVYQYANYLAKRGHAVNILHIRPDHIRDHNTTQWKRAVRNSLYVIGRRSRPRWFGLDRRVSVLNYPRQHISFVPKSDIVVATAMETANFVAGVATEQNAVGFYFIQGYENWHQDSAEVDKTWRLPLRKIVIAPWLAQKARDLGLEAIEVPNAIDGCSFPAGASVARRPLQVVSLVSADKLKRTDLVVSVMEEIARVMPHVELRTFGVVRRPEGLPKQVVHVKKPTPKQLRALYQESRIYICASDAEGFGLPPAEAMASGAAVVSTDISGVRGYAQGVALFSPPGDAAGLAENALRLLRDEALCDSLARSGQDRIRSYTLDHAGAAFEREILRASAKD